MCYPRDWKLAFPPRLCDPLGMHRARPLPPKLQSYLTQGRQVIKLEAAALRSVERKLDESFARAVEAMAAAIQAGRKIIVTGIGKSGTIGAKIASTLSSTGASSVVLDAVNARSAVHEALDRRASGAPRPGQDTRGETP